MLWRGILHNVLFHVFTLVGVPFITTNQSNILVQLYPAYPTPVYPIIRRIRQNVSDTFGIISYLHHALKSGITDHRHNRHDFFGPLRCRICRILLYCNRVNVGLAGLTFRKCRYRRTSAKANFA